jgi:hypothetical protein
MKNPRILLAVMMLALASLACQALFGGGDAGQNAPSGSTQPVASPEVVSTEPPAPADNGSGNATTETGFPMTDDAYNVMDVGDGSLLFYTNLSLDATMEFYRAEYTSQGYTEREILTVVSDGVFSMVFDGDPSGKAVVIQSVDLGDGSRTVSIRLEDV